MAWESGLALSCHVLCPQQPPESPQEAPAAPPLSPRVSRTPVPPVLSPPQTQQRRAGLGPWRGVLPGTLMPAMS